MAVGSPFLRSLELERHGLEWRWPEIDLAHPLDDGSAGVMLRSMDATEEALGEDGARWRGVFGRPAASFESLSRRTDEAGAALPAPPDSRSCASGCPRALPATRAREAVEHTAGAGALRRSGRARDRAAHPSDELVGRAALICACHTCGWAVARGGSRAITDALAAYAGRARRRDRDGRASALARGARLAWHGGARPRPRRRRPRRRRTDAGRGAARVRTLPAGPGRVQGRPRRRGRGAVGERGVLEGGHRARRRHIRRDRGRRAGREQGADAGAAVRPRRPAVPGRPGALERRRPPRSGPTPTCPTATTAT